MRPWLTYEQLVSELAILGVDLGDEDRRSAALITAQEGESATAILRWVVAAAAAGRSRQVAL